MFDYRNDIKVLIEKSLHKFIEKRIDELNLGNSWKRELAEFNRERYNSSKNKSNYQKLHMFLQLHNYEEIQINQLDVTAIMPLFDKECVLNKLIHFDVDYSLWKTFKNHIENLKYARNNMDHYSGEIQKSVENEFLLDQLNALFSISAFAMLAERWCPFGDTWKKIMLESMHMERMLQSAKEIRLIDEETDGLQGKDFSDAIVEAEAGKPSAQVLVGKIYLEGVRIPRDYEKAYMWFKKAANKRNSEAKYYIGKCYSRGLGVDLDEELCHKYYVEAANEGIAMAQYELSTYTWGKENNFEWLNWLKLSVEQKYPPAMWTLGNSYQIGYGVEKNVILAKELKEGAARLGYTHATMMLAKEAERDKDYMKAEEWYKLAIQQGRTEAERELKYMKKKIQCV